MTGNPDLDVVVVRGPPARVRAAGPQGASFPPSALGKKGADDGGAHLSRGRRTGKAARVGDGLMVGSLHDRPAEDQLPRVLACLDGWETAQGPGRAPRIAAMRFAYWGRDKEDVLRQAGPELARRQDGNGTPGADLDIDRRARFARDIAPPLGWATA